MPVPLAVDRATEVVLCAVFGCRYGVIRWEVDGHWVQAPVSFASVRTVGGYAGEISRAAARWLVPGARVYVTASAAAEGPLQELQIVEVAPGLDRESLGVQAISQGWAVPDAQVYTHTFSHQPYLAALIHARAQGLGIWGEVGSSSAALGLSPQLLQESAPALAAPHGAATWGVLALLAVALLGGVVRHGEHAGVAAAGTVAAPATRILRWYGGGLLGGLARGGQSGAATDPAPDQLARHSGRGRLQQTSSPQPRVSAP